MNRINIDGVWYVKEESKLEMGIEYEGIVFESNLYSFDCTRLTVVKYEESTACIEFKNKKTDKRELWDNAFWMNDFIENDVKAIDQAKESLCDQGIKELREVLTYLKDQKWI